MLPEAGATELIFLAAIALIVVGPKDLPVLMRKMGQWVAKMRGLAAEFRSSFDELARQSELDELRKEVEALRNTRMPDPLNHPTFGEINTGLGAPGSGPDDYTAEPYVDPHRQMTSTVVEEAPAPAPKPARAPRRPKAATGVDSEAKTKAPAKPRAARAAKARIAAEPEG